MKNYFICLLLGLLLGSGCKKTSTSDPQHQIEPFIRPLGSASPGKPPVKLTIGPSGGTIKSADGLITLDVPAGAVKDITNFEIQEVSSSLEGNNRPGFKLSPEQVTFYKPVLIRLNYANLDLSGSSSEMLAPCYQDAKGIYHAPQVFTLDKTTKSISVETTHFSTWTLYDRYRLSGPDEVGTEGNIKVKLMTYPLLTALRGGEPLLQEWDEAMVEHPVGGTDEKLKTAEWKLAGEGGIHPENLSCLYAAPFDLPAQNPVVISLSLTGKFEQNGSEKTKYTLLHPVKVLSDQYFTATINGVQHQVSQETFTKLDGTYILSGLVDGKRLITLTINSRGKGNFSFGKQGEPGKADLSYVFDNSNSFYLLSVRSGCNENEPTFVFSPGQVNITAYPQASGDFFAGQVSGAVLYQQANYCSTGLTRNISFSFNLKTY